MTKVKISVIIPARDTVEYLGKCIDSLRAQTIQDIEIIVVDDGSIQDFSPLIKLYENYSNILFLRHDAPKGPGGARNTGLAKASGEFVAFCDSDDWVDLNLYETAVTEMERNNADICIFSILRERDTQRTAQEYLVRFNQVYALDSDLALRILGGEYHMGIQLHNSCLNKVFRKNFIELANAKFEEGIFFQGILFNVYTFLHANKIICIPDVAYHHYRRQNSVVQSFESKHIHDFKECYSRMKRYFDNAGKFDKYKFIYYRLMENYMNLIVKQIFEFNFDETNRKSNLRQLLKNFASLVSLDEYFEYASAEEIRQHIQPHILHTTIY